MSPPTDADYEEIREREWRAAGPTFLVAAGSAWLVLLIILMIVAPIEAGLSVGLFFLALAMLVAGLLWGYTSRRAGTRRET